MEPPLPAEGEVEPAGEAVRKAERDCDEARGIERRRKPFRGCARARTLGPAAEPRLETRRGPVDDGPIRRNGQHHRGQLWRDRLVPYRTHRIPPADPPQADRIRSAVRDHQRAAVRVIELPQAVHHPADDQIDAEARVRHRRNVAQDPETTHEAGHRSTPVRDHVSHGREKERTDQESLQLELGSARRGRVSDGAEQGDRTEDDAHARPEAELEGGDEDGKVVAEERRCCSFRCSAR